MKYYAAVEAQLKREEFSLIVAETSDISGKEQVSINILSVDHEPFNKDKFFIGLYATASMTGESLFKVIKDALLRLYLNLDKLFGQCYDGDANMAGAKILYIHCAVHALDLAFVEINSIHSESYVMDSPKRRAVFSQIATDHSLTSSGPRPLCPTRVLILYPAVLDFLDILAYNRSHISPKARGLLDQLSQRNILFSIKITQIVFSPTKNLSTTL
ncbi:hypothetical protein PR048_008443 [Dryococelus australis]|uniref:DUF4371 domain-containing protein n=1 Tax=Dryococelus australis TaxID=614101 RepID=A0ABQ9HX51_9NEOP|nr:hypothetical protein PR048_008443 [Dryococelus australis]